MNPITNEDVTAYIEAHIAGFHANRLASLKSLKLKKILQRKNPYLFKAKNILTAESLVRTILDAHLSSQEESVFGGFLEGLAVFVCEKVFGGQKSSSEGIDLDFSRDGKRHLVSIKSGPNWGNSRQIAKMKDDFKRARKIIATNSLTTNVVCVNGCCYGEDSNFDKGDYLKLCGQRFWAFVSGKDNFYISIIGPLGHKAKQRNDDFNDAYAKVINQFTSEFMADYCEDHAIKWEKLLKLNSGIREKNQRA